MNHVRLDVNAIDYAIVIAYFVVVLGIGFAAKRYIKSSLDYFLSGRSLPAWITGLAFISANLGATEVLGMAANGAQYGVATVNYYWIGAVPAMVFLGLVMMPFYYGSKVRSVPEFLLRRFNKTTQRVQAVAFAVVSLLVAAAVVLSYTTLGGLSAAIYNEVLQFFVIVAALVPITVAGLARVGGYGGLKDKITAAGDGAAQLNSWPGTNLTGISDPFWSVVGIIFGLGFVLSFGYWTTNFVEVQRAMASKDMNSARRAPIIGTFPKMLIPFVVVVPGMIAAA